MKLLFFTLFITCFQLIIFSQSNKSISLKQIWVNRENPIHLRFKALDDYYNLNHLQYPDSALSYIEYHIKLATTEKQPTQLFEAYKRKGNVLRLKGLYPQAMQTYSKAEEIAKTLNNSLFIADILGNKGNIYVYQRDYILAINNFSKALNSYKEIGDEKGVNRAMTSIGNVFLLIQDYKKALEYFEPVKKSLELNKIEDRTKGILHTNMGWAYYKLTNWEKAKSCYLSGLKILLNEKALFYVADVYSNLALLYKDIGQQKEALQYVQKSIDLHTELKNSTSVLETKLILADLLAKEQPHKSLEISTELESEIVNSKDNKLLCDLYRVQYNCYKQLGKSNLALAKYEIYVRYNDSLQKEINGFNAIRLAYDKDVEMKLADVAFQNEAEKKEIRIHQLKQIIILVTSFFIVIIVVIFYIQRTKQKNKQEREKLLNEIEKLKKEDKHRIIDNSNDFQFNKVIVEQSIGRKLNETDWKVLTILLEDPTYSNRDIAEKACMSIDGIGSSLKRMYLYFEIKETKYRKIALIREVIDRSKSKNVDKSPDSHM
ncbi:MAG: hypothetical protein RL293_744 [Bacteroidota bacterium]